MPALPLDEAGKYVAGAYVTFFALVVVYVAIIGAKVARIARELEQLNDLMEEEAGGTPAGYDRPEAGRSAQYAGLDAPRR